MKQNNNGSSPLKWLLPVLILILAACVAAVFLLQDRPAPPAPETTVTTTVPATTAGETLETGETETVTEETNTEEKEQSPIHCTLWALKELPIYEAADAQSSVLETAQPGEAFRALAMENGFFRVSGGYLDSNYCMVNLPEYLGDLCAYQITNSVSSLYKIHGLDIPEVTGLVTEGYEQVRLEDGSFLVPLLYPAALKLKVAAEAAQEQGYRLKIYDAFRPWKATKAIYSLASGLLDTPIPEEQLALLTREELQHYFPEEETLPETIDPTAPTDTTVSQPVLTYKQLMTDNGRYKLGNFLAPQVSNHNRGIAVDLTMEKLETGEELTAQTAMHDLSWYSEPLQNTENADLLQSIMTAAGMTGLKSEWWHFQDNDAKENLELEPLYEGVAPIE